MKDLKVKKNEQLLKMTVSEMKEEVKNVEKVLFSLRMKLSLWELKQTHIIKGFKKYVARLNTLLVAKINNN